MLLDSEILRIRDELGFNTLSVGAVPYIGVTSIFDQVIQAYLTAGAQTTSSTATVATPTTHLVALTLASPTGFSPFCRISLDVDDRQESATVSALVGNVASVLIKGLHEGTYPVTVEGGEAIVREKLKQIARAKGQIASLLSQGGLKRAEDVEWYEAKKGGSAALSDAYGLLNFWRGELARTLGIYDYWQAQTGQGGRETGCVPC